MKFIANLLRHAFLQFLWGTLIAFIISSFWGSNSIQMSDNLCISGIVFLIFIGPFLLKPKELGIPAQYSEDGQFAPSVEFEPANNDESLVGLPEKEQKKYLLIDKFIVFIRMFGIGITLLFYSIFLHQLFGN